MIAKKHSVADIERRARQHFGMKRHDTTTETCLVIDGMNIAYQAYHAYRNLSYMGKNTSMLFGFPSIIKTVLQSYKADRIIVCWDGVKHPERMKLLPEYKMHREKTRDPEQRKSFINQVKRLRILLKRMGIAQAYNPNMEGDDMIYWVTKKMVPLYKIVIVSGDKDMHQLISYDVQVYNPRTKIPYSNFAYICDNLVEPYQFIDYLCLVGDSSDDIPGYRGIGPAKAAQFFRLFRGIGEYLKSNQDFPGMVDKEKLEEVWNRNRMMLDLKLFNTKYHTIKDLTWYKNKQVPTFNDEKYNAFCIKYGMRSMLKETFKKPFKDSNNG